MELRELKYFLAVAREENITKAAELVNTTQPNLSRQMQKLEEEIGKPLFRARQPQSDADGDGHPPSQARRGDRSIFAKRRNANSPARRGDQR